MSISNAGASTGLEAEAPEELTPDLVILATLVSQGPSGGDIFLVEHDPPDGVEPPGRFVGGDGYIHLRQASDTLKLNGSVRLRPGPRTLSAARDCLLLSENEPGATVHLDAAYVPWSRELLPGEFRRGAGGKTGDIE